MVYKGKKYSTIIWDWRSTLYDPNIAQLYPWVKEFLKSTNVNHILLSWASDPSSRKELINSFRINRHFSKIIVTGLSKREELERLFDKAGVDPEKTLVVGDNINDEIAIAKSLGVDSEHVDTFVKYLGLAKK